MRRAALVLLAAVLALAGCDAQDRQDRTGQPTSAAPSSPFTPVRVSVAPPPSARWATATQCPSAQAAMAAFGPQTRAQDTNADIGGIGCVYRIAAQASVDVTVIQGSVDSNREIWSRPPASIVRDAPELARGAVVVYTPPGGGVDQCLVAVDRADGTLVVQVSRRDAVVDRQQLCAPLGPALRLLADR